MDKNIILKELVRKLPETEGISYELQNDKLKVKVGEENEFEVRPSGGITCYPETVYDDKFHEAEILISNAVKNIKEYVDIMKTAPELKAEGLGEGFKKIIDFNNIVLAGKYLNDNDGFQFVTWMYDRKEYGLNGWRLDKKPSKTHYINNPKLQHKHYCYKGQTVKIKKRKW